MNRSATAPARANWAAKYREARKVRRFIDSQPVLHGKGIQLAAELNFDAFCAAARVDGKFCSGSDPLVYMIWTRLLLVKSGCPMRMPYVGRLPA